MSVFSLLLRETHLPETNDTVNCAPVWGRHSLMVFYKTQCEYLAVYDLLWHTSCSQNPTGKVWNKTPASELKGLLKHSVAHTSRACHKPSGSQLVKVEKSGSVLGVASRRAHQCKGVRKEGGAAPWIPVTWSTRIREVMMRPYWEKSCSSSFWVIVLGRPLTYRFASRMEAELGRAYETCGTHTHTHRVLWLRKINKMQNVFTRRFNLRIDYCELGTEILRICVFHAVVDHWVTARWLYCLYLASTHTGDITLVWQEKEEAVGSVKQVFYSERDGSTNMNFTLFPCCLYQITLFPSFRFKFITYTVGE